jgi:hypothetical protein
MAATPPNAPPTKTPTWEVLWVVAEEEREDAVMVLPAGKVWVTGTMLVYAIPLEVATMPVSPIEIEAVANVIGLEIAGSVVPAGGVAGVAASGAGGGGGGGGGAWATVVTAVC